MKSTRNTIFIAFLAVFAVSTSTFGQINKVVALLKGTVTCAGSPATDVAITVLKGSEVINKTKSTTDGKFQVILQPGTQYKVTFSGNKYYYYEEALSVPQSDQYQTVPMSVTLKTLEVGRPYTFSNLIFEPKSSQISPSVMGDMESIASALKHNNKLMISATVYPDETPSSKKGSTQSTLAESRKSALMSYFLSKNVASSNLSIQVSPSASSGTPYERTVTADEAPAKGKKKKKAAAPAATSKKMMIPQNAEITMQMAS